MPEPFVLRMKRQVRVVVDLAKDSFLGRAVQLSEVGRIIGGVFRSGRGNESFLAQ
ncbi:hypothetical protein [Novipirellula sp.]|uniref:hypothetical protein n=1 Tax=Novipirellula sp. TaxID=2795430 RepID=UPI00356904C7